MRVFRLIAFRLIAMVAIVVCTMILVDYIRPVPAFCGFQTGCEEVIHSAYGRPLGLPLPLLGLIGFLGFFCLTLYPSSNSGRLLGPLSILAGLIGLTLVSVQVFVLHQTCPFCLAVDAAAMLLAVVELGVPQSDENHNAVTASIQRPRRMLWAGIAVFAILAPVVWAILEPAPEVPSQIKSLWTTEKFNVVEITDFTCQYCRQSHSALEKFLDQYGERIHFVRLVVPLKHYDNSRPAAKAYLSAVRQGKGEPMANALFASDNLSPDIVRKLATQLHLDMKQYDTDIAALSLDAQIDETSRWVLETGHGGLPQIWIQNILLVGVQTPKSLEAAFRRAERVAKKHTQLEQ